jgi:hypothetical protein
MIKLHIPHHHSLMILLDLQGLPDLLDLHGLLNLL